MTTKSAKAAGAAQLLTPTVGAVCWLKPESLRMERNIRDAKPDAGLVASVKDVGIIEPPIAVLTDDGSVLLRTGHRRTLAAIEAGCETIPVYIHGTDSTETDAEIARIVAQYDENTHREGLSTADEVGVVEQLAAFGLSAAQIAKKSRIKRAQVDTALTVAGSELAKKATDRYADLTLEQAAVVAEFEDDAETVKALIVAASKGQFDHVAQRARDERHEAALRSQVLADLEASGVTVIDRPGYDDKTTRRLSNLCVSAEDKTRLDQIDHTTCEGHVAWVDSDWAYVDQSGQVVEFPNEPDDADMDEEAAQAAWEAYDAECARLRATARNMRIPASEFGCTNWRSHGHVDPYSSTSTKPKAAEMSEEEREAAKAQRTLVIENNKAWTASQAVRRQWVAANIAKAKTPPKGAARFIATALCTDPTVFGAVGGNTVAAEWLGKAHAGFGYADLSPAKSATENRCTVVALVQVLAGYESNLTDGSWRHDGTTNACGRYLRFLKACGYGLSDVEKFAASDRTA